MSVIIVSACAKDETGDMTDTQVVVPEASVPEAAPVWYPTPKKLIGAPGAGIPAPAVPVGSQPSPAAPSGQQPAASPQYEWPSDDVPDEEYTPWQLGPTPSQAPGATGQPGMRRPWGAIDQAGRPPAPQTSEQIWQYPGSQPAWGPGYPPQQVQPQPAPGAMAPVPPGYPVYVW